MRHSQLSRFFCLVIVAVLSCPPLRIAAQQPTVNEEVVALNPAHFHRHGLGLGFGVVTNCFDSYLSPNRYDGLQLAFQTESWRVNRHFDGRLFNEWLTETSGGVTVCGTAGTAFLAMENVTFAMPWKCLSQRFFSLYAGAEAQARVGGIYNTRNSNNPINAKAGLHLGGMVMGEFSYRLGRLPMRSSVRFDMPLVGAFFCPYYTQSYFELFSLHSGEQCVCFASPFNCPSGRLIINTDFTFRQGILRLSLQDDNYRWQSTNSYALSTFTLGIGYVFNTYHIRLHEHASSLLPY